MCNDRLFKCVLLVLLVLIFHSNTNAQVSLASDAVIDFAVKGYDTKFTVIKDGKDDRQWYYMPDMPRLVEKKVSNQNVPEFTLLRYQYHSEKDLGSLVEGGFLQFGITTQIPTDAFTQIKDSLERRFGGNIKLGSIIFKSASVNAYSPVTRGTTDSSEAVGASGVGGGIAPVFSTQKMVFSFPYNKVSSNIINTLVNSQTGIPVFVTLNYIGLTPKVGFKVEWDWKMVYHHYSSDKRFSASASYFGLFGGSYDYSAQEIWNTLTSDNSVKVTGILGEGFTAKDLETYLQPILARINTEILAGIQPPAKVSPAVAANPSASGKFFSAGYSVAIKNENEIRDGKGSFDFNIQNMVERTTVIGGFMGIGNYSDEVKKLVVLNSTEDDYKSASIMLPGTMSADMANELKVNKIDLSLSLVNNDRESDRSYVSQLPVSSLNWQDRKGRVTFSVALPLMQEWSESNGQFKKNAFFSEEMNISTNLNYTLHFNKKYKAYTGDGAINSLSDNRFNIVAFSPDLLGFKDLNSAEELIKIDVSFDFDGNKVATRTIRPVREAVSGTFSSPQPLKYIVPNLDSLKEMKASIVFFYKGSIKHWKYDNQNLKDIEMFKNGNIIIQPQDIL